MERSSRTLRNVNLAVVIVTGIELFLSVLILMLMLMGASAMSDPEFANAVMSQLQGGTASGSSAFDGSGSSAYGAYDYSSMTQEQFEAMIYASAGYIGLGVAFKVFALIAGILGMRNADKPEKLGAVFVMDIIAAIVSVFTSSMISLALFIVSAVFANRVRAFAAYQAMGGAIPQQQAQQPQVQQQPAQLQQPQQQETPVQPETPAQPEAPAQPEQPQQQDIPEPPEPPQAPKQ